jgi:hypothetical protein
MRCHECARGMIEEVAVGQCRFCLVGLCKNHLVDSFRGAVVPRYACEHRPELAYADRPDQRGGSGTRVLASSAAASRIPGRFRHWLGDRPSMTKEPVGS